MPHGEVLDDSLERIAPQLGHDGLIHRVTVRQTFTVGCTQPRGVAAQQYGVGSGEVAVLVFILAPDSKVGEHIHFLYA